MDGNYMLDCDYGDDWRSPKYRGKCVEKEKVFCCMCFVELSDLDAEFCDECWKDHLAFKSEKSQLEKQLGGVTLFALLFTLFVFFMFIPSCAHAAEIDMGVIAQIESSGCVNMVGDGGASVGCWQVGPGALADYNRFFKHAYSKADLLDKDVNFRVANWYLNVRIPEMLKAYGKPDTVENRLVAYNAGIAYVVKGKKLPTTTKEYLIKYAKAVSR